MPPKRTKANRSTNYNTKLRKAQAKNRLIRQSLQNIRNFPTTAAGFFRLSIHSHFELTNALGVPKSKVAFHLGKTHGRTPQSILTIYHRICSDLEKYDTFDVFEPTREETVQKKIIGKVLESYLNKDGTIKSNPTYREHIDAIRNACDQNNIPPASRPTITKYTYEFAWTYLSPTTVTKLQDPETMEKRVIFAQDLKTWLKKSLTTIIWMDEMTFYVHKNRAKRLAPMDHSQVFFTDVTPAKVAGLSISTYMTRDQLIKMNFRWINTDTEVFKEDLLKALLIGHEKIDPRHELVVILDNAPWHSEHGARAVVEEFQEKIQGQKNSHRQVTILFTSPNSPDLNLVEYFNRHYKATLRRALDSFSFLTINREHRRGRPATKNPPLHPKPRKVISVFSANNLISLAKYVYRRIKQVQHPVGTWNVALNHVFKWIDAIEQSDGDYKAASVLMSKDKNKSHTTPDVMGRLSTPGSDLLISTRISNIKFESKDHHPVVIQFTPNEVNLCAVERGRVGYREGDLFYFDRNQFGEGGDAEEEDTDEEGDDENDQNDRNDDDDDDDGFDLDADAYVSTKAGKRKAARQLQPPTRAHRNRRPSMEEEEDDEFFGIDD